MSIYNICHLLREVVNLMIAILRLVIIVVELLEVVINYKGVFLCLTKNTN